MTTAAIRALFRPELGTVYLDAATYGLPPRPTVEAMARALTDWQAGRADWRRDWEPAGEEARGFFAQLIGAAVEEIALVPTVSVGMGPMVASLQAGDEVVVPDDEFASLIFPLLVAAERRGVVVRTVPFAALAEAVDARTRWVAFSLVQSQGGRTAPLAEICRAARSYGARVLVDATHAIPFVDLAADLPAIDVLICHGYKHLLAPRGAGFLYVRQDRWDELPPVAANWRSADPPYTRSYGGPLAPAAGARRFDVSLDWLAWVGARESLRLLVEWQRDGALAPVRDLARELAARLGAEAPQSSIVSVAVDDASAVLARLSEAGIRAAAPDGRIRLAPHVYNTGDEVDRAVEVLAPLVRHPEN